MKNKKIVELSDSEFEEFAKVRIEIIAGVRDICYKYGAKPFLDCGTLLGAVRDNKIIRNDNDMDLGMRIEDLNHEMIQELKYKFYVKYEMLPYEKFYFLALRKKDPKRRMWKYKNEIDMWVDIYFYYPYKDGIRLMCSDTPRIKHGKIFHMPDDAIQSFKEIEYYGEKFLIPGNAEKWLETYYGPTWRIPNPRWGKCKNYKKDIDYKLSDYSNLKFDNVKLF